MSKRLLYFTLSYPYGIGEQWKRHELLVLKNHFNDITVIPFDYGGNPDHPKSFLPGIKYKDPLFTKYQDHSLLMALAEIFLSKKIFFYLKELILKKVWTDRRKLRRWILNAHLLERLRKHPVVKAELINAVTPTIAYFFWSKKSAEIIPFIKNSNVKKVTRFHGFDLYQYRYQPPYLPFQNELVRQTNKILLISTDGKNYLSKLYPNALQKMEVLRLGTCSKGKAKSSKNQIFRIISCSSVIPLKRINLIADSLYYLDANISLEWTHIGDGPLLDKIKKKTEKLGSNIITNFPGWIDTEEVMKFYIDQPVDLFINVSETEGVPVSIMEAMSAGIPVLATDVGGTSEIVNETNGKLLSKDINPKELAKNILAFHDMPSSAISELRDSAFRTYDEKYNAFKNAESLAHLLINL